jgi:hypothetical protein
MLRCDSTSWQLLLAGTLDTEFEGTDEEIVPRQRDSYSPTKREVKAAVEATFGRESVV